MRIDKKASKIVICIILVALNILCITSCGIDLTGSAYTIHTYEDSETGVNYLWINSDSGVAITPRYNADGTLYVVEE